MDSLTSEELRSLSQQRGAHSISIYLPTHPAAPENQQDPIRLKNLVRTAHAELQARGVRSTDAERLLAPVQDLVDDGLFWRPQPGGLAIFLRDGEMTLYRLPASFEERVVVNERFHIRPLLPEVDRGERFYVLALAEKAVRLYSGDRSSLVDVPLGDMPRNLMDALRIDELSEQMQFQTQTSGGTREAPGRGRAAVFFGNGPDTSAGKRYQVEYCKRVAAGIRELVPDKNAPFVVAAVEDLASEYRLADEYHDVTAEAVEGNPELLPPETLHARAWPIARRVFEQRREQAMRRFRDLQGTGQATSDAAEVVRAAAYGRVDSLFVSTAASEWGVFDSGSGRVALHAERAAGDEDLVDLAATETILHGGEVWAAEVSDAPLAALLRY